MLLSMFINKTSLTLCFVFALFSGISIVFEKRLTLLFADIKQLKSLYLSMKEQQSKGFSQEMLNEQEQEIVALKKKIEELEAVMMQQKEVPEIQADAQSMSHLNIPAQPVEAAPFNRHDVLLLECEQISDMLRVGRVEEALAFLSRTQTWNEHEKEQVAQKIRAIPTWAQLDTLAERRHSKEPAKEEGGNYEEYLSFLGIEVEQQSPFSQGQDRWAQLMKAHQYDSLCQEAPWAFFTEQENQQVALICHSALSLMEQGS